MKLAIGIIAIGFVLGCPAFVLKVSDGISVSITAVPMEEQRISPVKDAMLEMSMETMSSLVPSPEGDVNSLPEGEGDSAGSLPVQLAISLPEAEYGHMGHIEVFIKEDLVLSTNWAEGDSWIPTCGSKTVYWIDPSSADKVQRFYFVSGAEDTDGDGHSDLYEAWVGNTDSNMFDEVNADGDDLHDWFEMELFGDLSQTGTDDYDLDGLLNGEELVSVSANQPAIMISNPARYDSDNDGLNDFDERCEWGTDPMDRDTDCDGRDDAAEVLGSPRTDPHNSDTIAPVLMLAGG